MIHPDTEVKFINAEIGYGVVATRFIPKGTITWVLDALDREFTPIEVSKMKSTYRDILDTYSYRNNQGNFVLCWDNARFVNHSFHSNCITTAYDFEIAVRDIQEGEQLTDDYGYLNVTEPFEAMPESGSRTTVYPDDLKHFHQQWDAQLLSAFPLITGLNQPLQDLLSEDIWNEIKSISSGNKQMKSILTVWFQDVENHHPIHSKPENEFWKVFQK